MIKKKIKKNRYYVNYTKFENDLSVSYNTKYFSDYFDFVNQLKVLLDNNSCHITSVYKDYVCVG